MKKYMLLNAACCQMLTKNCEFSLLYSRPFCSCLHNAAYFAHLYVFVVSCLCMNACACVHACMHVCVCVCVCVGREGGVSGSEWQVQGSWQRPRVDHRARTLAAAINHPAKCFWCAEEGMRAASCFCILHLLCVCVCVCVCVWQTERERERERERCITGDMVMEEYMMHVHFWYYCKNPSVMHNCNPITFVHHAVWSSVVLLLTLQHNGLKKKCTVTLCGTVQSVPLVKNVSCSSHSMAVLLSYVSTSST